jgi:hypothetical protein
VSGLYAQSQENVWRTFAMLAYEQKDDLGYFKEDGQIVKMIQAYEGKEIEVKGYIIPLSGKKAQSHFMFSAYPYASCFFCGQAGPETVIEVFTKDDQKIAFSEKTIKVKGTFFFVSRNPNHLLFKLENAEPVE